MRPVRRGASPQGMDFSDYQDAKPFLISRLGSYCSFCERRIPAGLAVEHIQAKIHPQHIDLIGRWENFLLACVNCNATKGDKDVDPLRILLPDRDNTFAAFTYEQDGSVGPSATLSAAQQKLVADSLSLTGLDKKISAATDENGKLVAIDRVSQRMEAWLAALDAKRDVDANPGNEAVTRLVVRSALATGFFSIWMAVFDGNVELRDRLIDAFTGARGSGCFDPQTSQSVSPAPNPDGLPHGGKS